MMPNAGRLPTNKLEQQPLQTHPSCVSTVMPCLNRMFEPRAWHSQGY